ncbi:MAG: hypothetical protein R3B47_12325 [Bacteroidia bacterium]
MGLDLSGRYQLFDWLYGNADFTYTYARSIDEEAGQDYIPLAPDFTMTAGLNLVHPAGTVWRYQPASYCKPPCQ